jgi:alpha-glucosidase
VVRHASRFALPPGTDLKAWVTSDGLLPPADEQAGLRRARAATLMALALPGSTYLYQGEELGLPEVADLPRAALQDPVFRRSGGAEKGRDGCRVPLPWTVSGSSFGFGPDGAHLPQPDWFGRYAAGAQAGVPDSTLTLYTRALAHRRRLRTDEKLEWAGSDDTVHFVRPNGWTSITNFGPSAIPLPAGELLLTSGPLEGGALPPDTTAWLQA